MFPKMSYTSFPKPHFFTCFTLQNKETKENNTFVWLEHEDNVKDKKITKLEAFQNLKQILNLNKCINILSRAVFHRYRGWFFFFFLSQVHLFVVQVISVAKCMSRTSQIEMKERNRASKSKWFSLIYVVKRVLLQDFWYIISTKLFFLSLSKEWGLLLSQRIKSAKLAFKTERHFP